ncbi:hypothetical protein JHK82_056638 [Glycine max]|nr:hypothetical protein JHK85_057479 [Glycine max]KAG5077943.1 hypothetical protein JHK82_056638 [Glycine max]
MGSNEIEHLSEDVLDRGFEFDSQQKKDLKQMEIESQGEKFYGASSEEDEDVNKSLPQVASSSRRGLEHCITAPVGTERNPLIVDDDIFLSRSTTGKWEFPRQDTILDRLSEKVKQLITNLVKIQNDGTVEVDIEMSASVAPELLELQSFAKSTMRESLSSESKKSVPRLQIVILVVGTRGDVQPFLAIAKRLQEYGHHVRLATHDNFKTFVKSANVDFYPLGGDPRILAGYMARNKGLIPSGPAEISVQRKQLKAIIDSLPPACTAPDMETGVPFRAQAIIANPPAYGHVHVAEALAVPLHIFFTMPWTPTYEFPHPLARVPQSAGYWLSYIIVDLLIWWGMRRIINNFRKTTLKLAPIAYFSMYRGSISHLPTSYMWSPHVVPKPSDWGPLVDVVGYCFLSLASKYQPREDFVQWIKKGPPPLYFGFGSMPLEDPKGTTDVILEALKDTEQRGIIDRGWGNLGNLAELSDNVFLLEECPHDWLFPQCSAVVHHGGAGTTATGLKAGCPTTIVPFFGDQFFWGDRIYEKELGPAPIPISQLNVENLSNAIRFMLQPEVKSRAMEIAKLIENEDGVAAAVDAFHRHLPDELPLPTPTPTPVEEEDHLNPLQWFFLRLGRFCCAPCGGVNTPPLPDTGQWLLLALNEKLPTPIVEILRARIIGLHHFLMLFMMLAFSVLFDSVKAPGLGLGARYMFTMAVGRLLRAITFASTILPSARPWCAGSRFRVPGYPHRWAQKYYVPYATDHDAISRVIKLDTAYVDIGKPVGDYQPDWGSMSFLIDFLRPTVSEGPSWYSLLKKAGGGCNDLLYSGHMLVAVLTAMAWTEAYGGFSSALVWLLVMHSAQREIRERHHYTVDCVVAIYVGILLWKMTGFIWSHEATSSNRRLTKFEKIQSRLIQASKDSDIDEVRELLKEIELSNEESKNQTGIKYSRLFRSATIVFALVIVVLAFTLTSDG